MRFLRERRGQVESAWVNSRYTAAQRRDALTALSGAVALAKHPYERDPASGAGNCWCGRAESSSLHVVVMDPANRRRR